jgi:hypothetical protein
MAYKIQHLGLGEILDQSIAITKDHFGLLFGTLLVVQVPFLLAIGIWSQVVLPQPSMFATPEESLRYSMEAMQYFPITILVSFGAMAVQFIANVTLIHNTSRLYLGEKITFKEAITQPFRGFFRMLITTILMYITFVLGYILCFVPFLFTYVLYGLSQHVVIIEGTAGPEALSRSRKLAGPNWLSYYAVALFVIVISAMVSAVNIVPQPYVRVLMTALLTPVLTIWSAATWVVFYYSCRCAVDNFDLFYLADSIRPQPATADAVFGSP